MKRQLHTTLMAAAIAAAILAAVALLVWSIANAPAPFNDCPCHL